MRGEVADGGGDRPRHDVAVVGVLVGEDVPSREVEAPPDRVVHARVPRARPHDPRRVAQQIEGAVGGAAVHHHVLEARVVLAADAGQGLGQEPLAVEDGRDDAHEGHLRRRHGRERHTTGDIIGATGA